MRRSVLIVLFALLSLAAVSARVADQDAAGVLFGPYVNSVTESSGVVLWVTSAGVQPGSVTAVAEGEFASGHRVTSGLLPVEGRAELLHAARLTDLRPGTRYRYEISSAGESLQGTFSTAPREGEPVRFVVYGDTRSRPEMHGAVGAAIAGEHPDFVVNTGDLVANGQNWDQWPEQFFGPATELLRRTALWPVRGNHERDAVLYRELFELPGNELFYSFDWGDVHFVVLDSHGTPEQREEMLRWLEQDLAANDARWTFVTYHVPTFNVGGHASQWGRDDVLPIMERHGVDMVFNGHSHLYERFRPIGPAEGKPIVHVVTGGGGAPNYPVLPSPMLAGGIGSSTLHHCVLRIDGPRLEMSVKEPDGTVIDQFTLVKGKDGLYQDEVMARAVETEEAAELIFAFARLTADLPTRPEPGRAVRITLDGTRFPEGSSARVSPAEGGEWDFEPLTLTGGERAAFEATPPESVGLEAGSLSPPLLVDLAIDYAGESFTAEALRVRISHESLRALFPPPEPIGVGPPPAAVSVDGDRGEWEDVPALPLPYHEGTPGDVKLAWSRAGLYGLVVTEDADIEAAPERPWAADSLEVFVDKELSRASDIHGTTGQYVFSPAPERGAGRGHVLIPHGANRGRAAEVPCRWRPVEGGYVLEFLLPAGFLEPGAMEAGRRIGLNFALNDDGRAEQQFYADKGGSGWRTPFTWGVIELVEATGR
ncbi:MAG: metallophosphoesterase [Candidatus Brocadiia bacterium]